MKRRGHVIVLLAAVVCLVLVLDFLTYKDERERSIKTVKTELEEISLTEVWSKVLDLTSVENRASQLETFRLDVTENRKVQSIHLIFQSRDEEGVSKAYFVDLNSQGYLKYRSGEIDRVTPTYHPLKIFEELDKLDLGSLMKENRGLSIETDFATGGRMRGTNPLYLLDNGSMRPLEGISFVGTHSSITISMEIRGEVQKTDDTFTETQSTTSIVSGGKGGIGR